MNNLNTRSILIQSIIKLNIDKKIFIIGGVASGKSTLINMFKKYLTNIQIIDSGLFFRYICFD